jgi:1,4-alpha-glucan branching enzyme
LYEHTRKLIQLRKTNGALKTDHLEFIHLDEQNKVIAWKRWDDAGTVVAVVVNFSDRPLKGYVVANFPKDLNHEFIYDYPVQVNEQSNLLDDFGPSEAKVYLKY